MSLTLDDETIDPLGLDLPPALDTTGRATCRREGCANFLPAKGEEGFHTLRKYCDDHQPSQSPGAKKRKEKLKPEADDPVPRSITNNFTVKAAPTRKATGDLAEVEEGAKVLLALIPMILALTGDEVCPVAINDAIPAIAHQLAELAKYHPFIKKIFASGEGSGEVFAWLGLLIAASPVVITVLAHHGVLSRESAGKFSSVVDLGKVFTNDPDPAT